MKRAIPLAVLVLAVAAGCPGRPAVTDTGYAGTWSRGNESNVSIVSIVRDGEAYRFRWNASSSDGSWKVVCDWDGHCEERVDDGTVAEYDFEAWIDDGTGHLMVECTGRYLEPNERSIHYVDELVLEPGGMALRSHTVERNGQSYSGDARPMRLLEKMADAVANPPRGTEK